MAKKFRVRINRSRLHKNMSKQEGRALTAEELNRWLEEAGFTHDGDDYWIVSEPDLGHLDPSEVLSVEDA
jgi:hypothetical protein